MEGSAVCAVQEKKNPCETPCLALMMTRAWVRAPPEYTVCGYGGECARECRSAEGCMIFFRRLHRDCKGQARLADSTRIPGAGSEMPDL